MSKMSSGLWFHMWLSFYQKICHLKSIRTYSKNILIPLTHFNKRCFPRKPDWMDSTFYCHLNPQKWSGQYFTCHDICAAVACAKRVHWYECQEINCNITAFPSDFKYDGKIFSEMGPRPVASTAFYYAVKKWAHHTSSSSSSKRFYSRNTKIYKYRMETETLEGSYVPPSIFNSHYTMISSFVTTHVSRWAWEKKKI